MASDTPTNPETPIPYPPNRAAQLTLATQATDKALGVSPPGAGGWTPPPWAPLAAALVIGVIGSIAPVLATMGTVGVIAASVLSGIGLGLGAYFGLKSAGPRTLAP